MKKLPKMKKYKGSDINITRKSKNSIPPTHINREVTFF